MRKLLVLFAVASLVLGAKVACAQVSQRDNLVGSDYNRTRASYQEELDRERYETAIARERAERAYLEHQAAMYEYQRDAQERSLDRADQQQGYYNRSNNINSVNQVANTAANIAWQIQALSRGHLGW